MTTTKRTSLSIAAVLALVLGAGTGVQAAVLTATDLNTIAVGNLVDTTGSDFLTPSTYLFGVQDMGDLEDEVYFNSTTGLFTYIHFVTPQDPPASPPDVDEVGRFVTAFPPEGFDSTTHAAGWDFNDSGAAGGNGDGSDFVLFETVDLRLAWLTDLPAMETPLTGQWDPGETIAFFFQSTLPPLALGNYNLLLGVAQQDAVATGISFAPGQPPPPPNGVPEPGTFFLLGSALMALGLFRRRQRS